MSSFFNDLADIIDRPGPAKIVLSYFSKGLLITGCMPGIFDLQLCEARCISGYIIRRKPWTYKVLLEAFL